MIHSVVKYPKYPLSTFKKWEISNFKKFQYVDFFGKNNKNTWQ